MKNISCIHLILFALITLHSPTTYALSFSSFYNSIAACFYSKPTIQKRAPKPTAYTEKKIYVCSDLEGEIAKLDSFIEKSGIFNVTTDEYGFISLTFKDDTSMFIFIGDAIDKGNFNVKVVMALLKLKEQYPDRVILLLGNRDINKLRFFWELNLETLDLSNPETKFSPNRFRLGEWEGKFEAWIAQGKNKIDGIIVDYTHGKNPETDIILKVKWILEQTMGDPDNFEDFKQEIRAKNDRIACAAYIIFIQHIFTRYLQLAQLIYLDEDTKSLFVHGGLSKENFGYIPESEFNKQDHRKIEIVSLADLRTWVSELNSWGHNQIAAGIAGNMLHALPIIQYQEPTIVTKANGQTGWGTPNKISVIHGRPWDSSYNLAALPEDIALVLANCGVNKLVFGHSPIGQVPVILKTDLSAHNQTPFVSVATDTSVAKPARNAAVEISREAATVYADYYDEKLGAGSADQIPTAHALIYSSTDPIIGTATMVGDKKYWHISTELKAHWRSVNNMPFGLPEYVLA